MTDIKTITLSSKGQICIPKEMRIESNFKEGEKLVMIATQDQIVIRRAKNLLQRLHLEKEGFENTLLSENSLKKDWENKHDEKWNQV